MREFTPQLTAVSFKLTLDTLLAQIPGPGTLAFNTLCHELKAHKMSPAGISLEVPTTRLGDVVLRIPVLEERAFLQFTYFGFELAFESVNDWTDIEAGGEIVAIAYKVLESLDRKTSEALTTISLRTHLILEPNDMEIYFREHLGGLANPKPSLLPEAFSYSFVWPDAPESLSPRIVLARSFVVPDALFLDFTASYRLTSEESSSTFDRDFTRALEEIGLRRSDIEVK
jgi:hypothetical protein